VASYVDMHAAAAAAAAAAAVVEGERERSRGAAGTEYGSKPLPLLLPELLPWRLQLEASGGGLVMDVGSHVVDLVEFLLGPITGWWWW